MKGTKNTKNADLEHSLETSLRVDSILSRGDFGGTDTTLVKMQILEALSGKKTSALALMENGDFSMYNELPKELQQDRDIVLKVSKKNPEVYQNLSTDLKQDMKVQESTLSSLIENGGGILELLAIVEQNTKNQKKLKAHITKLLEDNKKFFFDEASLMLYQIYLEDPKSYELMIQKGIFADGRNGITLSDRYISILVKHQKDLEGISPEQVQEKLLGHLIVMLGISASKVSKRAHQLFTTLISQINIVIKDEEEDGEEDQVEITSEEEDEFDKDDEIQLSVGPYNYAPIGNSCKVWDNTGISTIIEKKEFESMNEKSLERFMNFSKLMKNLGLEFLVTKQHRLAQLVTDVNFYEGEGMSEGRTLKFLNSVGKNIGVPQDSYEDSEGKSKTGCFKSVGAANMKFREIRDTGNIGNLNMSPASRGDKSIVEIYMKMTGFLVEPFGELSVAKWKA